MSLPTKLSTPTPDLVLIDASSYVFRAYHALPPLSNSRNEPTGAVVGVVNMLRRLTQDLAPRYIAAVFDAPGPTFRDQLAPDYKAQRPPVPADLIAQIAPLYTIVRALGLPLLTVAGVEADDVIGTLATQAEIAKLTTLIVSGDKDFAQLVTPHISLLDTMTERYLDVPGVKEKFGVYPHQMLDFLTLTGDQIDNIPGIPGCGPKTAQKWLEQYGNLDNIIARAEEITTKVGTALRNNLTQLHLSRKLVTIKRDVTLTVQPQDLVLTPMDVPTLRTCYQRLEAKRLLATLPVDTHTHTSAAIAEEPIPTVAKAAADQQNLDLTLDLDLSQPTGTITTPNYQTILDWPSLKLWLARLAAAPLFAFDTETTSLNTMQAELVGISFAVTPGQGAYVPLAHTCPGTPKQLDLPAVLAALKPLLENPRYKKIGQNPKYDMNVLARYGIEMQGIAFDTMLESYCLDPTASRHDLDTLAAKYLNHRTIHFTDVTGKGAKQIGFAQVGIEQATPYAAEDADITLRLHNALWPRLQQQPDLAALLRNLEMPLLPVLSRIERAGVCIDAALLKTQSYELATRLQALEHQAHALVGHQFNICSPKQISTILFQELNLPIFGKTPGGTPATGVSILEKLAAAGHALPKIILEHRTLAKLQSTYLDPLPRLIDSNTGRVHTSYHQAVTATGRLSSSNPNLQNIPIRTEDGRRIRKAFIAAPGYSLLAADYSQIELRIMAHLSDDTGLLQAFAQGKDVHRATAAEVFDVPVDAITDTQRRSAKAINFGLIYGMSAYGLARQLNISNADAKRYVDLYFQRYPGVKNFMERTRAQAHQQGFVQTLVGRRLYLPEINHDKGQRRAATERTAINAPMQGTAADIIKLAMLAVDAWLGSTKIPARMIMQVHDELVLEVRNDYLEPVRAQVTKLMQEVTTLKVPLVVDTGVGANWEAAH